MIALFKTSMVAGLIAAGLAAAMPAHAADGNWLVRGRMLSLQPADKSDAISALGVKSDAITVESKVFPEFDISYFFTKNLAVELVLTYPQTHRVYLDGGQIGSLKHLPPSLLAQYHFTNSSSITPYVGAGINYTRIWGVSWEPAVKSLDLSLEKKSFGPVVQVGADFAFDKTWSLNLDAKYVKLESDLYSAGAKVSTVKLNPVLLSVGVGYRF